jgi:hypothetical protein
MSQKYKGKISTVNQTGRQRILRTDYVLKIKWPAEGCAILDVVSVNVPESFSAESRIFVDVNHKRNFMRFDCGTKASLKLPDERELTAIGRNNFRAQIRIVDASGSGLVVARTAPVPRSPPEPKTKKISGKNADGEKQVQLFVVKPGDFGTDNVPIKIEFPTSTQKPVVLRVNQNCEELLNELCEVSRAGVWVLAVLPHLRCILQRVVSECRNEEFDPSEDIHPNSKWQALWNNWAHAQCNKGLQDIDDLDDFGEVDVWIDSVLTNFCSTIGNPVKQVNRLMGGA